MSRADLYKKFRNGDLEQADTTDSEDSKLNLSKAEAKNQTTKPSQKNQPDSAAKPATTVIITKGNRPPEDTKMAVEPDELPFGKNGKTKPDPSGPGLFSLVGDAIGWLIPPLLGIGLALGMVALIFGAMDAIFKDADKSRVAANTPKVQQTYHAPRHPTTDFFITDDGELVKRTAAKNIKRIGTVISTDPQHLAKRVKTGKHTKTVVDKTHNPLTADFTYLILDNGDRLPASIAIPWLKNPVALYGAVHGYTQRRMLCLARPINKCSYLHQF